MINLQEKEVRVVICDEVKAEDLPLVVEEVRRQYQRCGRKLYYASIVPEDAPMPDGATRQAMTQALRDLQEFLQYGAVVFCGGGLKASMKRTAFAGMLMVMMKAKYFVAASIEELIKKAGGDLQLVSQLRLMAKLAGEKGFHP